VTNPEKRCKHVCLGLVVSPQRLPIAYEDVILPTRPSVSQEFSRGFLEQIAAIDPQAELVVVMTPLTLNWLPSLQGAWQLAFEFVR